jgi:hypothetical protein
MEPIDGLEDVSNLINDFLEDASVWCKLEWDKPLSEDALVLAQFSGRFDFCDVVWNEREQEIALEFLFHPEVGGTEVPSISLPIDPDDVEVNILDNGLEIQSLDFCLFVTITNRSLNL